MAVEPPVYDHELLRYQISDSVEGRDIWGNVYVHNGQKFVGIYRSRMIGVWYPASMIIELGRLLAENDHLTEFGAKRNSPEGV